VWYLFHVKLQAGLRFKLGKNIYIISKILSNSNVQAIEETFNETIVLTQNQMIKELNAGNLCFEIKDMSTSISNKAKFEYPTNDIEFEKHKDSAIFKYNVIKPLIMKNSFSIGRDAVKQRVDIVNSYKDNQILAQQVFDSNFYSEVSVASVYRWIKQYQLSNHDIRSLIPGYSRSGGKNKPRMNSILVNFIVEEIHNYFLNNQRVSITELYLRIVHRVSDYNQFINEKISVPSYSTITRYINTIPEYEFIAGRYNKRFAESKFGQVNGGVEVSRPLERVEIDGTPLDLIVTDEEGDNIGRPTFIVAIDKLTRYVVGFSLSFGGEGWQDVMLCIKHILMDKSYVKEKYKDIKNEWLAFGVPETIVIDNGLGFKNKAMVDAAYQLGINLQFCPVKTPQWKGSIERFFRTSCINFVHNLPGTTKSNPSQLSDTDNPSRDARISLTLLVKLFHKWAIDVYSQMLNKGAGGVPAQIWKNEVQKHPIAWPNSIQEIAVLLGKVEFRRIRNTGIELINTPYNSLELNKFYRQFTKVNDGKNTSFKVKYDPFDMSKLFVYDHLIDNRWLEVPSIYPEYTKNLSEWEHKLICKRALLKVGKIDIIALAEAKYEIQQEINDSNTHSKKLKAKANRYDSNKIISDSNLEEILKSNVTEMINNTKNTSECSIMNPSDIGFTYQTDEKLTNITEKSSSNKVKSTNPNKSKKVDSSSMDILLPGDFKGFEIVDY
jgi:putative transposase